MRLTNAGNSRESHNDVIENVHAKELTGFDQSFCSVKIFGTWRKCSTRMIVSYQDSVRVTKQSCFEYLTGMD